MIRVEHGFGCTAPGWTAVLDAPDLAEPDQARAVVLLCWACGRMVTLTATTPAAESWSNRYVDDPFTRLTRPWVPAEHAPRLVRTRATVGRLPASIPPARFAGVWLHVERLLDLAGVRDVLEWLVADDDGNVLGEVWSYLGPRGGRLFRWAAPSIGEAAAGGGEGLGKRGAAVRRLLAAVYPTDDDGVEAPREEPS